MYYKQKNLSKLKQKSPSFFTVQIFMEGVDIMKIRKHGRKRKMEMVKFYVRKDEERNI